MAAPRTLANGKAKSARKPFAKAGEERFLVDQGFRVDALKHCSLEASVRKGREEEQSAKSCDEKYAIDYLEASCRESMPGGIAK